MPPDEKTAALLAAEAPPVPEVSSSVSDTEWRAAITRARTIDPASGDVWTLFQDTNGAVRYFRVIYGFQIAKQTLAHQRSKGVGIKWQYFGQKPVAALTELDRHAREALRDVSPLSQAARARAAKRRG